MHAMSTQLTNPVQKSELSDNEKLRGELRETRAELGLPGHEWAEPSIPHLRQLMRQIYTAPDEARRRGEAARRRMVERFSPERLAEQVRRELVRIDAALPTADRRARREKQEL